MTHDLERTSRDWLITRIDGWVSSGKFYGFCGGENSLCQDITITDRNLNKLRERYTVDGVSLLAPARWATIKNCKIRPGAGSGTMTVRGMQFRITYAWGGRDLPDKDSYARASYTVRLRPIDDTDEERAAFTKKICTLFDYIFDGEGGVRSRDYTVTQWLTKVAKCRPATLERFRAKKLEVAKRWWKHDRADLLETGDSRKLVGALDVANTEEAIDAHIAKLRQQQDNGELITFEPPMLRIAEIQLI